MSRLTGFVRLRQGLRVAAGRESVRGGRQVALETIATECQRPDGVQDSQLEPEEEHPDGRGQAEPHQREESTAGHLASIGLLALELEVAYTPIKNSA